MEALTRTLMVAVTAEYQAMLDLTRELIAIPTENPPGTAYAEAVALLCRRLEDLGFEDTRVEGDCVLSFVGAGTRTVYFSGHYDVVPAQRRDQFEPRIQGANLFGRGSSDMKSGLAAMIYAAKAVRDAMVLKHGRIGLVFVPDEETAGPRGSRHLAERGLLGETGIAMLTPEPTGAVVWNANRGAISLRVTLKGKSAHVGRQREGVNAFENMLRIGPALLAVKEEVEAHRTAFRIAPDGLRHSILMLGGRAEAGTGFNVVPDACSFTIDRRLNPEEDFETERGRLLKVLDGLEVDVLQEGRASGTREDDPVAQTVSGAIQIVTGRAAQFEMCPGLLETRFYAERGIPAFAYGPGLLTVSHGPNEFVPVERLVQCAQVYAITAAHLLGLR